MEEVRISIPEKENLIYCSFCFKGKTRNGYEEFDENGDWFCSYKCDSQSKLGKYYF